MAAVLASPENDGDRRASKDLPHLSLSLDSPPSSSPFPSPSSSFIPPPMPGAHEYANKFPIHTSKKKQQRDSAENNSNASTPAPVATTPASAVAVTKTSSTSPATSSNITTNGMVAAKTRSSIMSSDEISKQLEQIALASSIDRDRTSGIAETRAKRASRASLNSSRRAPLSPSVSRRTSGAQGHIANNVSNGNHSNKESLSLSRAPSNAKNVMMTAGAMTAGATESATASTPKRRSRGIKIRDFAFPAHDLRHTGQGPDAARPGRSRPASEYGGGDSMNNGNNSRRNSGWGAFRWAGSKLWGFALGGGAGGAAGSGNGKHRATLSTVDTDGFIPTSSDFARNFDASSPQDEYPPSGFEADSDYQDAQSDSYDDADLSDYPDQDIPLLPGLYRAMYAFVPEGTAEMALAEDQVIRIVGRGGGVGWAVAEDENGNHALVPESYLEPVKLDEDVELEDGESN
ncbi:hypothetical protein ACEPAI_6571 [Sanghuangporus weigelae]